MDCKSYLAEGVSPLFPPVVEDYAVKIACERPDPCGRSLSQWDCIQIANELMRRCIVEYIGRETVRLILAKNRLKPWRYKMWLSAKVVRDKAFAALVTIICDL